MPAVEPILKDLTAIKVAADRQVKVRSAEPERGRSVGRPGGVLD